MAANGFALAMWLENACPQPMLNNITKVEDENHSQINSIQAEDDRWLKLRFINLSADITPMQCVCVRASATSINFVPYVQSILSNNNLSRLAILVDKFTTRISYTFK